MNEASLYVWSAEFRIYEWVGLVVFGFLIYMNVWILCTYKCIMYNIIYQLSICNCTDHWPPLLSIQSVISCIWLYYILYTRRVPCGRLLLLFDINDYYIFSSYKVIIYYFIILRLFTSRVRSRRTIVVV